MTTTEADGGTPTPTEKLAGDIADAAIAEIARQTCSALGNTGHDDYQDIAIGGLDSDQGHITICRSELGAAILAAVNSHAELEAKAALCDRMAEALRELTDACISEFMFGDSRDDEFTDAESVEAGERSDITFGHIRKARAILSELAKVKQDA